MKNKPHHITLFEHDLLKVGHTYNDVEFTETHRKSLEKFYGEKGVQYYSLIHKGVRMCEYVGVIQLDNLIIEVLPKADKYGTENEWRNILINMLRAVGAFNIHAPSSSSLNIKSNFILDLYFELFIKEVEYLVNKGLIKKYRKQEGNTLSLKGSMMFSKHVQRNLVHQERFYVKHTVYDNQHLIHKILFKTICLLTQINTNTQLQSRIGNLLLHFPELKDLTVTDALFNTIKLNRKTKDYKNSLEISRLLLLNYHPDLSNGKNNVLALMFDMNLLWEQFIYISLRKNLIAGMSITAQTSKYFWKSSSGGNTKIRPDIHIRAIDGNNYVLDTKWKTIGDNNPTPEDLRQLYVYHEYYKANKVALVYPGGQGVHSGKFYDPNNQVIGDNSKACSIIKIPTNKTVNEWQEAICDCIYNRWLTLTP